LNVINVLVDKDGKAADYDVFDSAWRVLLQRFETQSEITIFRPRNPEETVLYF